MAKQQQLWLCLPPSTLCLLDLGLTLRGQPLEYWANYQIIREANPLAIVLLTFHPGAFFSLGLVWIALFTGLILVLPRRAALTISIAIAQAHAWAAGGWVAILLPHPFAFLGLLFAASALLTVAACERSNPESRLLARRTSLGPEPCDHLKAPR